VLNIRRYESSDHAAVWNLHNIALDAVGTNAGDGPWDDDLRQIEAVYLQNGGDFLVGICAGRLVAMGALKRTNADRAEIKRMRVHPDYQRRGFGQAILTALEKRAAELGYKVLHLDTTIQQTAAQGLYQKNGYVVVREGKIGRFDCVFYEKKLETMGK
jgi:ribosomal protein S18 acetylase RimI-like enzyme